MARTKFNGWQAFASGFSAISVKSNQEVIDVSIRSLFLIAALLGASVASAHAHLKSSKPAEHSVLSHAPKEIMLHFPEATRLTALSVQKAGDKTEQAVSVLPKQSTQQFTIPLTLSGPGDYTVKWRALGDDNHISNGEVHFSVKAGG